MTRRARSDGYLHQATQFGFRNRRTPHKRRLVIFFLCLFGKVLIESLFALLKCKFTINSQEKVVRRSGTYHPHEKCSLTVVVKEIRPSLIIDSSSHRFGLLKRVRECLRAHKIRLNPINIQLFVDVRYSNWVRRIHYHKKLITRCDWSLASSQLSVDIAGFQVQPKSHLYSPKVSLSASCPASFASFKRRKFQGFPINKRSRRESCEMSCRSIVFRRKLHAEAALISEVLLRFVCYSNFFVFMIFFLFVSTLLARSHVASGFCFFWRFLFLFSIALTSFDSQLATTQKTKTFRARVGIFVSAPREQSQETGKARPKNFTEKIFKHPKEEKCDVDSGWRKKKLHDNRRDEVARRGERNTNLRASRSRQCRWGDGVEVRDCLSPKHSKCRNDDN